MLGSFSSGSGLLSSCSFLAIVCKSEREMVEVVGTAVYHRHNRHPFDRLILIYSRGPIVRLTYDEVLT